MTNQQSEEGLHLYDHADATFEDLPLEGGGQERVVRLRLKTSLLTTMGESPSSTPWVIFPLVALERLSEQLAVISESAKRWTPGAAFPIVGGNLGVNPAPQDDQS
jgi:hypothetical protein